MFEFFRNPWSDILWLILFDRCRLPPLQVLCLFSISMLFSEDRGKIGADRCKHGDSK